MDLAGFVVMYAPHNVIWLVFGSVVCALLFAAAMVLRQVNKPPVPGWVAYAAGSLAAGLALLTLGIRSYDRGKLRSELCTLVPAQVTRLVLTRGGVTTELTNHAEISALLSALQSLSNVAAHHSHPTDPCDFAFDAGGIRCHYRIGRDSENTDEYLVFRLNPTGTEESEIEIGRVRSNQLGRTLENLLKSKGADSGAK